MNPGNEHVTQAEHQKLKKDLALALRLLAGQSFQELDATTQSAYYQKLGQIIFQLEN